MISHVLSNRYLPIYLKINTSIFKRYYTFLYFLFFISKNSRCVILFIKQQTESSVGLLANVLASGMDGPWFNSWSGFRTEFTQLLKREISNCVNKCECIWIVLELSGDGMMSSLGASDYMVSPSSTGL